MSRLRRTALRLVPSPAPTDAQISFCSHCAARPGGADRQTRVCEECGLGVLLEASAGIAPLAGGAFLVADQTMSICAVSRGAEELLEISEVQAVHRHLTALLTPADIDVDDRGSLAFAISCAVSGDPVDKRFTLRPVNLFGVRLRARIGSCGPSPGALVVLER